MEPGHEDREYAHPCTPSAPPEEPQWSPVMKTGNTRTGGYSQLAVLTASMEPGHEDREYAPSVMRPGRIFPPQWSPVMKTGNTSRTCEV